MIYDHVTPLSGESLVSASVIRDLSGALIVQKTGWQYCDKVIFDTMHQLCGNLDAVQSERVRNYSKRAF
jgi:hypothetical protein